MAVRPLASLSDEELRAKASETLAKQRRDRQEAQILYYRPASLRAAAVHRSAAHLIGVSGGNGSSKSETVLAEIIALASGVLPYSVREDLRGKFRGPVQCRIVVESLTTTLYQTILPKLQWWHWTGLPPQGGGQGHWGWAPKMCLLKGDWQKSWSGERTRTLTLLCRNPDNLNEVIGRSSIQFMSHDQDPSDFASGDYHHVMLDEPPRHAIFVENQARTMRVAGRLYLAMTWPDDPSIPVDWVYDEVYERGRDGPNRNPDVDWHELYTTENKNLDQTAIARQMERWTDDVRKVRIFGQPIRFSNRIHPLFTDYPQTWSFKAGKAVIADCGRDPGTGSADIAEYCHVSDFEAAPDWPAVWLLDPHPRKPHMYLWAVIDPSDDIWIVADGECEGDPAQTAEDVHRTESEMGLIVAMRLIDPNMGRSPSGASREVTWQDEFAAAGLPCGLASDSDVGRGRVNEYLTPDPYRRMPRLHVHSRCRNTIFQMKRYTWGEFKHADHRDLKQIPRDKYDDYPTLLKYLLNQDPRYSGLRHIGQVIRRTGKRRSGY